MFPFGSILTSAVPPELVSLSGANRQFAEIQPFEASIILSISAVTNLIPNNLKRGYVQWDGYRSGTQISYQDLETWVVPTDFTGNYWVRATDVGTTPPDGGNLDVWLPLVKDVNVYSWWLADATPFPKTMTIRLEIATDALGTDIVATDDYAMTVLSEF